MLLNLHKKKWADGLTIKPFDKHSDANQTVVSAMQELADSYEKAVVEEDRLTAEALAIANVGRQVRPPCRSPPSQ
jgi:26S proteasome regulatory subunit N11